MRIVAGSHGGRRITAPPGDTTRPTSDRVREALFSMLGPLSGARVLDLYAGSGALGLEALSRGAGHAVFVERDRTALTALRGNVDALGLGDRAEVRSADAVRAARDALGRADAYDLVFLDPPYRLAAGLGAVLGATLTGLLAPGARIVTESPRSAPMSLPDVPITKERRYGDTLIRIHAVP